MGIGHFLEAGCVIMQGYKKDKIPGGMLKNISFKKNLPLILTGLVALGLVGAAAYVHFSRAGKTHTVEVVPPNHPGAGAAGVNDVGSASGAGAAGTGTNPSNNPPPPPAPTAATDPKYNSQTLAAPSQTFNKSHTPISLSQTNNSQPDYPSLDSTCQSVVGATCEIHAIKDGVDLLVAGPLTITDDTTGSVSFPSWNASDKHLTPGAWIIKAVAKKGGQISTSSSNYTLMVNS